ncbi:MAG: lysylphosphatidylglycerol synthase domain-containing protein [Actinomycetaceae bacterium]|nr:lysylphosphatidylglycerol synthase domain-containing protein [Actinomycetaceae bacterium]
MNQHSSPDTSHVRVLLVDTPDGRVRRLSDILDLGLTLAGVVFIALLALYAHGTLMGVTGDVSQVVHRGLGALLFLPVSLVERLVTILVPTLVLISLLINRAWRTAILSFVTAGLTIMLVTALGQATPWIEGSALYEALAIPTLYGPRLILNPVLAGLSALLTASGEFFESRAIRLSWLLLGLVTVLTVVSVGASLPTAIIAIFLGRACGLAARLTFGVIAPRAAGELLIQAIAQAGIRPRQIIRIDAPSTQNLQASTYIPEGVSRPLSAIDQIERFETWREEEAQDIRPELLAQDAGKLVTQGIWATTDRRYLVVDSAGERHVATVIDSDRRVAAMFLDIWDNLRVRGMDRSSTSSLHDIAERVFLMSLAAKDAGIRTPVVEGVAKMEGSVVVVEEHIVGTHVLELSDASDAVWEDAWTQLLRGHRKGLTHRSLTPDSLLVDEDAKLWVTSWSSGEIGASDLARRIDHLQLLTLSAIALGPTRALELMQRTLTVNDMVALAPLIQALALPQATRTLLKSSDNMELLRQLREEIFEILPSEVSLDPSRQATLSRFPVRTFIMVTLGVFAVIVVAGSLNFQQVAAAVMSANAWWVLASFALGLLTYIGSAMVLIALTPEKLDLRETLLTQVEASFVALVAPAGIGPATVNMRLLTRTGVSNAVAVATVTLVQLVQVLTVFFMLVTLASLTGDLSTFSMPSGSVLSVIVVLLVSAGAVVAIPRLRNTLWARIRPTWVQIYPRLIWLLTHPRRLALAVAGSALMAAFFIASFAASLAAFGRVLPVTTLAITYLAATVIGALIPSPGGIGPIEAGLTGGLTVAGVPSGVALSAAMVFRLVTFWGRAPLGWLALKRLEPRPVDT